MCACISYAYRVSPTKHTHVTHTGYLAVASLLPHISLSFLVSTKCMRLRDRRLLPCIHIRCTARRKSYKPQTLVWERKQQREKESERTKKRESTLWTIERKPLFIRLSSGSVEEEDLPRVRGECVCVCHVARQWVLNKQLKPYPSIQMSHVLSTQPDFWWAVSREARLILSKGMHFIGI